MKYEEEITVEVSCSLETLKNILFDSNFKVVEEYDLNDIYMVEHNYINEDNNLELLKHCVLIRNIIEKDKETKLIIYKHKEYNTNGDIIKQGKVSCKIDSIEDAKRLLESINYKELIKINDHLIIVSNGIDELAIQLVNDKHIYIEIEDKCNSIDKEYLNTDEMKDVISKYNIPIVGTNYYVKKAEIELKEKIKYESKNMRKHKY